MAILPFKVIRSFKVTDFGANRKLIYDFLLLINTNLPPILHRFGNMALHNVKNRYIWIPHLRLNLPTEGFPWDDLRTIFRGCQQMARVSNGEEKNAENFNWLSKVHERYRRQTDGQTDWRT